MRYYHSLHAAILRLAVAVATVAVAACIPTFETDRLIPVVEAKRARLATRGDVIAVLGQSTAEPSDQGVWLVFDRPDLLIYFSAHQSLVELTQGSWIGATEVAAFRFDPAGRVVGVETGSGVITDVGIGTVCLPSGLCLPENFLPFDSGPGGSLAKSAPAPGDSCALIVYRDPDPGPNRSRPEAAVRQPIHVNHVLIGDLAPGLFQRVTVMPGPLRLSASLPEPILPDYGLEDSCRAGETIIVARGYHVHQPRLRRVDEATWHAVMDRVRLAIPLVTTPIPAAPARNPPPSL